MSQPNPIAPKPWKDYTDLVSRLENNGMIVPDRARAERKISQIGYYRLSGYWYPCRQIELDDTGRQVKRYGLPMRSSAFQEGTNFDDIVRLYIFDKRLRQLILDAVERIEVNIRTIIAHVVGQQDALAYENPSFINPKKLATYFQNGKVRNQWHDWLGNHKAKINRSREDHIEWHKRSQKAIPFWVAVEAWDFGTMSKYFELLKMSHQTRVAEKVGVSTVKNLVNWLREINTLRNRCAHHARIWNQSSSNPLNYENDPFFHGLPSNAESKKRMLGLIAVIGYLTKQIGPGSRWIEDVAALIDDKPNPPSCSLSAMGIPEDGFPRAAFGID